MPNITSSGTITKESVGFDFLGATPYKRLMVFSGASIGDSAKLQYKNDQGSFVDINNGDIPLLPSDKLISLYGELQIVTTGSPNFNVTNQFVEHAI